MDGCMPLGEHVDDEIRLYGEETETREDDHDAVCHEGRHNQVWYQTALGRQNKVFKKETKWVEITGKSLTNVQIYRS